MKTELKMIYWKSGKFWLGKFEEHPEIMTQGRTLKELEENLRDAYKMWVRPEAVSAVGASRLVCTPGTHARSPRACVTVSK